MSRTVDQDQLGFVRQVDATFRRDFGVRITDLQDDLRAMPDDAGNVAGAYRTGTTPEGFVRDVAKGLGMAPASDFDGAEAARDVNRRRAALATLAAEDPRWVAGAEGHDGAIVRDHDGGIVRLSLASSREGTHGFGTSFAENASLSAGGVPAGADFRHVASGLDIKDALASFDHEYEPSASAPAF